MRVRYIVIDESGDLSLGRRSPRHFVIAASTMEDVKEYQRISKKIRRRFKRRLKTSVELKHSSCQEIVAKAILLEISKTTSRIYWVALDKTTIRKGDHLDFSFFAERLFSQIVESERSGSYVVLVDRFSKRASDIERLHQLVSRSLSRPNDLRQIPKVSLSCIDSMGEPAMQVHDFVVGSIFRSLERNDSTHLDIINDKVVFGKIITMKDLFWF